MFLQMHFMGVGVTLLKSLSASGFLGLGSSILASYVSENPIVSIDLVPDILKTRVPYSPMSPGCKAPGVILWPGCCLPQVHPKGHARGRQRPR